MKHRKSHNKRKKVLFYLDEDVLELFKNIVQNRSEVIEDLMRSYIGKHGTDPTHPQKEQ